MEPTAPGLQQVPSITLPQGLFQCGDCKRSYSRADHLQRHVRSHTQEKPFPCIICQKRFSRADLLKRHAANHTDEHKAKRMRPSPGGRVSRACTACSSAKLKCEEVKPCQRCVQRGITCEYATHDAHREALRGEADVERRGETIGFLGSNTSDSYTEIARTDQRNRLEMTAVSTVPTQTQAIVPSQGPSGEFNPTEPLLSLEQEPAFGIHGTSYNSFLKDPPVVFTSGPSVDVGPGPRRDPEPINYNFSFNPYEVAIGAPVYRDVLGFGIDNNNLDLDDIDYTLLSSYNESLPEGGIWTPQRPQSSEQADHTTNVPDQEASIRYDHPRPAKIRATGERANLIDLRMRKGVEAFNRSLWRWIPNHQEAWTNELQNLSLAPNTQRTRVGARYRIIEDRLEEGSRGRMFAMVLNFLDSLINVYFDKHVSSDNIWLHPASFKPNQAMPELVTMIAAAGAVLTPVPTVQKVGFALQEATRMSLFRAFESSNSHTRELQALQAYMLNVLIASWSGNKRKIQLAESFGQVAITMLRRAGKFRLISYPFIAPLQDDRDEVLEKKWRTWVEYETFKRLVNRLSLHDTQISISLLIPPLISYAEVSLPFPCPPDLFLARSAQDWRKIYYQYHAAAPQTPPGPPIATLGCITSFPSLQLPEPTVAIDHPFARSLLLHTLWGLIWEFRQLSTVSKPTASSEDGGNTSTSMLVLSSRHQDLLRALDSFRLLISNPAAQPPVLPHVLLLLSHLTMSLHVSLEDLQLFGGKEGQDEATRVLPLLQSWVSSRDARAAIFHAGQTISHACTFKRGDLRDFWAVAVYHASLVLWGYGILLASVGGYEGAVDFTVPLNCQENEETKRFVQMGIGKPVLQSIKAGVGAVCVDNPKEVMREVIAVLKANNGVEVEEGCAPIVENLATLMADLGKAADGLGIEVMEGGG